MFGLFIVSVTSMMGGWRDVPHGSEFVENALPYVSERYQIIFPEYRDRDTLLAFQSAAIQIVNGYNIRLSFKLGFLVYDFMLYVKPSKKISLTSIQMPQNILPEPGGWAFLSPESEPELVDSAIKSLKTEGKLNSEVKRIIMVRKQIIAGQNIHVLFEDSNGVLHSAITTTDLNGISSVSFHGTC